MSNSETSDLYALREALLHQEKEAGREADAGIPGGYERWAATCDRRLDLDEAYLDVASTSGRDLVAKISIIAGRALAFDVVDDLRRLASQMITA
jgi:hypothetical protein